MGNPISASERKGILVLAAIALITALLAFISYSRRPANEIDDSLQKPQIVVSGDTVGQKTVNKNRKKDKKSSGKTKSSGKKGTKQKKAKKQYERRSPLDEPV